MRMLLFIIGVFTLLQACTNGSANSQNGYDEPLIYSTQSSIKENNKKIPIINSCKIYLDNSYSMKGYYNAGSDFLSTFNKLITHISNINDDQNTSCNFNYTNNRINYFENTKNSNIGQFLGKINNFFSSEQKGDKNVTDLKNILKSINDSIQQNTINIIITDRVPSLDLNGQESGNYFDILIYCIFKSVYSKLIKCEFATQIIKCKSVYSVTYINQLNKCVKLEGVESPYYIFVMGEENRSKQVTEFIRNSILSSNYQSVVLLNNLHKIVVKSKLLLGTGYEIVGNASDLKIHKNDHGTNQIKLQLLTDLRGLYIDDEYTLNPDNYSITPVEAQISISKITNVEDPLNNGFSHKILVTIPNIYLSEQIKICLRYKLPVWINETKSTQDISLPESKLKQKTFGFQYIVNGFLDGCQERKLIENYVT